MSSKKTKSIDVFKPSSDEFIFRDYPMYWVFRLSNRYTQKMEVPLKELKLNIIYWRVGLTLQSYGKLSMSEIAKHAVGRLPTITKAVYRMQELGLVTIIQSEKDKRITMVEITEDGNKAMTEAINDTSRTVSRSFEGFTVKEIETFNCLLKKMFDNLSE